MTIQVAGSSRRWAVPALTFISGVALSYAMPIVGFGDMAGRSGAASRMSSTIGKLPTLDLSSEMLLTMVGLAAVAILGASSTVRNACVSGLGSVFGASRTQGGGSSASTKQDTKKRDAVHDGLEKQLNVLLKTISGYIEASSIQSDALSDIRRRLEAADTVEQIQVIVELLAQNSTQSQKDAEALRANLNDAQKQTVALRQKLVTAEKLAALDPLTSLPNRRSFQEFLETAVAESHADYTPLTVIMADIDHFKRVNDKFGHATGDAVIRQFGKILSGSLRATDMVARYGGEEFVFVLKKTPVGNAVQVVERIRANIAAAAWLDPSVGPDIGGLTASFGVAEILDNEAATGLIERADQRLYAAKKAGRNRAVWTSTGNG